MSEKLLVVEMKLKSGMVGNCLVSVVMDCVLHSSGKCGYVKNPVDWNADISSLKCSLYSKETNAYDSPNCRCTTLPEYAAPLNLFVTSVILES